MPFHTLKGKTPISFLPNIHVEFRFSSRVFDYYCYVHDLGLHMDKLDARSMKVIFFSYSPTNKGYKYFVPSLKKWFVIKDVIFIKDEIFF